MIIDSHAHLWAGQYKPDWNVRASEEATATYFGISLEDARKKQAGSGDPTGAALIAEMNAGGVDISVVVTIDYGLVLPGAENDSRVPLEQQFAETSAAAKKHGKRLIWGAGIDPRRVNAPRLVDKAVKEYGARVLKFYPPGGYYPNDRIMYPMYEKAVELGIPVQLHMAPVGWYPHMRSKYCQPIHLDDVAVDFPDLKIETIHSGGHWWEDLMAIAEGRPNIYLDVAGWQGDMHRNPVECFRRLRHMFDRVGSKRVMWASDWVGPTLIPQAGWLKTFQNIPAAVREAGIDFKKEEMNAFFGETAAEFFGISGKKPGKKR